MSLQLRLEPRLTQKLELRVELVQQLQLVLPDEFEEFICFEGDEDIGLLEESLPFLILHEACHPLSSRRVLEIPHPNLNESEEEAVDQNPNFNGIIHNANEIGIDRGAIIIGPSVGYSLQRMIEAHTAISERVVRDTFEYGKIDADFAFLARVYAGLREHEEQTKDRMKERIIVASQIISENVPKDISLLFHDFVAKYRMIYKDTQINQSYQEGTTAQEIISEYLH